MNITIVRNQIISTKNWGTFYLNFSCRFSKDKIPYPVDQGRDENFCLNLSFSKNPSCLQTTQAQNNSIEVTFTNLLKNHNFLVGTPNLHSMVLLIGYFGGKKNIKATVMACCYPPLILHIMVFIKKAKNDQVSNGLVLSV